MANNQNKEIILARHPKGVPTKDTFKIKDIAMPNLKDGEVLLRTIYVSVDPGIRGFMDKGDDDAAGTKIKINEAITSKSVAEVIESKSDKFKKGSIVHGRMAWKKYQAMATDALEKVNPSLAPISTAVSLLGVPGFRCR